MSNAVVPFQGQAKLPAYVTNFFTEHSNIDPKDTIPQLSFRGKVWRIVINGEEEVVNNKDGEPVSTIKVVVLSHNKMRSRAYYEGAYQEGKSQRPACWSSNGERPNEDVKEPQAPTCATCPNSKKGSKITDAGKESYACATYKRVALIPYSPDLTFPALLLRVPQTSMWDGNNEENEAKGWYAWDQFIDMLRARGATHTGAFVTKIKFDARTAYPKLLFAGHAFLSDDEIKELLPRFDSEEVKGLLNASEATVSKRKEESNDQPPATTAEQSAPTKAAKVDADQDDDEPTPVKAPKGKKAKPDEEPYDDEPAPAKKATKPVVDSGDDEDEPPSRAAKPPKKAAPAEDEDDDEAILPAKPGKSKPAPAASVAAKPAKQGNGKDKGLEDLLEEFDV